jgi:hypothetical protein
MITQFEASETQKILDDFGLPAVGSAATVASKVGRFLRR